MPIDTQRALPSHLTQPHPTNHHTVVIGGNLDQSRRHHNLILQALGAKITLRLRTSRFGLLQHKRTRAVKNHNLMAFKGPHPLPPHLAPKGHPTTADDFHNVRELLRALGVQLEAEAPARARMERLRLQNGDSVRSTASCCSDCGGSTWGKDGSSLGNGPTAARAHYVPLADLFAHGRGLTSATATTASSASLHSMMSDESVSGDITTATTTATNASAPQQEGCGEGCDHSGHSSHPHTPSASGASGSGSGVAGQSPGWHCRSFRKTDKGILVLEE